VFIACTVADDVACRHQYPTVGLDTHMDAQAPHSPSIPIALLVSVRADEANCDESVSGRAVRQRVLLWTSRSSHSTPSRQGSKAHRASGKLEGFEGFTVG
jgi:hypothetical protein